MPRGRAPACGVISGRLGKGGEAPSGFPEGAAALRIAVLSSTPLNRSRAAHVRRHRRTHTRSGRSGHGVELRPLGPRTGFHTLDRWLYNLGVALSPPRGVDLVIGVDLDGFLWAAPADAVRREPQGGHRRRAQERARVGPRAAGIQARWEGLNTRRRTSSWSPAATVPRLRSASTGSRRPVAVVARGDRPRGMERSVRAGAAPTPPGPWCCPSPDVPAQAPGRSSSGWGHPERPFRRRPDPHRRRGLNGRPRAPARGAGTGDSVRLRATCRASGWRRNT